MILQFASTTLLDRNTCNSRGIMSKSSDILQSPMMRRRERKRKRTKRKMNDEELLLRLRTPLMGGSSPAAIRTTWSMGAAESGYSCLLYTRLKDGYGRMLWNLLFQLPQLALCRFCNLMVQWKFLFI